MSESSRRTRTVIGGLAAGGALAALAPAGLAAAGPSDTEVDANTPGIAVGRPDLKNPAPGLRVAQQFGDSVFNQSTQINRTLDDSPLGTGYHQVFGQAGNVRYDKTDDKYYYDTATGKNGTFKGILNTAPADQFGNVLPVRECNLKGDRGSGAPGSALRLAKSNSAAAQCRSQPALRFLRFTATFPHSEKPRTFTRGAPGRPCSVSRWSNVPITPWPRSSTFTSGGTRIVWPPMIE